MSATSWHPSPQGSLTIEATLKVNNDASQYGASFDEKPQRWVWVKLMDREAFGEYEMANGYANANGFVSFTVNNDDGLGQGTLDPFIRVYTISKPGNQASWVIKTVNPGETGCPNACPEYSYDNQDWPDNIADGTHARTLVYTGQPQFHVQSRVTAGYDLIDNYDDFGRVHVKWDNTYEPCTGSCYDAAGPGESYDDIHIWGEASDPDEFDVDVILHETGHHVLQGALWNDAYVHDYDYCPNGHGPNQSVGLICAFTEGFANFFQAAVQNSNEFSDLVGIASETGSFTLEDLRSGYEGDNFEASVAGTMLDLFDSNNEGDDDVTYGVDEIFLTIKNHEIGPAPPVVSDNNEFHLALDAEYSGIEYNVHLIMCMHSQMTC